MRFDILNHSGMWLRSVMDRWTDGQTEPVLATVRPNGAC